MQHLTACVNQMSKLLSDAGVPQSDIDSLLGTVAPGESPMPKLGAKLREVTDATVELGDCVFKCGGDTITCRMSRASCKTFCGIDPDTTWGGDRVCGVQD